MRVFTFLKPGNKPINKKSETDKNVPSYEEVLTEVEKRIAEKKKKKDRD